MPHLLRTELGGAVPAGHGSCLLSLLVFSDVQVMDSVSPARCEWVELLADEPRWKPLLHMHRPYEALTHWALAAHVDTARRKPAGPWSARRYDLALFTGDNIDNAQRNELDAFLAIVAGGATQLSAEGGVHQASAELGPGPWPYWCPRAEVADQWKPLGYPALADFVERAGATVRSEGLGLAWASLPGNHDLMRQGTALPEPLIERIAVGSAKSLRRPAGLDPADPLARFIADPAAFSQSATRQVRPDAARRAVDRREWLAAHVAAGAIGYDASHAQAGISDFVIDTEHARIIGLDTNHPGGDCEGSIGAAQLEWLDARLSEVDATPGRFAVLASHHGTVSLTNTYGHDPQRLHAAELTALAHRHPCVVAWLVGHRHLHRVVPHPGPGGGFWEITTGSLIDWPSQGRAVEFMRHPDGTLEIVCSLLDHDAPTGSQARLHHQLAQRFAGASCGHMQGQAGDGDVRLLRTG